MAGEDRLVEVGVVVRRDVVLDGDRGRLRGGRSRRGGRGGRGRLRSGPVRGSRRGRGLGLRGRRARRGRGRGSATAAVARIAAARRGGGAWPPPPPPEGSTTASTFQWTPNCSASAVRRTSSLPLLAKLSRAPAFRKPSWRVVPSKPVTCAFWLSRIQVKRRLFLTTSRMFGHRLRGSSPPAAGGAATGAERVPGAGAGRSAAGAPRRRAGLHRRLHQYLRRWARPWATRRGACRHRPGRRWARRRVRPRRAAPRARVRRERPGARTPAERARPEQREPGQEWAPEQQARARSRRPVRAPAPPPGQRQDRSPQGPARPHRGGRRARARTPWQDRSPVPRVRTGRRAPGGRAWPSRSGRRRTRRAAVRARRSARAGDGARWRPASP